MDLLVVAVLTKKFAPTGVMSLVNNCALTPSSLLSPVTVFVSCQTTTNFPSDNVVIVGLVCAPLVATFT